MPYQLGVDLGTTFTTAAVRDASGTSMLGLGNRALQIPSVLLAQEDGTLLVGEAAERRGVVEPGRLAREFKRRLGDDVPVLLAGQAWAPQLLMARLLRSVVDTATERMGGAPEAVMLTHPASWGAHKLGLLTEVVRLAGTGEAERCTEPEAAAAQYAAQNRLREGDRVAVYDLGGGTFDACVVERTADGFRVLGRPEGIEQLGGVDFDDALFHHVLTGLGRRGRELDLDDEAVRAGLARLRRECVDAKESLSSDVHTVVPVFLSGLTTAVRVTRSEFEALIRTPLGDTVGALGRALASAGVEPADLTAVVLVGGSSRIPLVSELLHQAFGLPVALDTHPEHAVALGAVRLLAERQAATSPVPASRVPRSTLAEVPAVRSPVARRALLAAGGVALLGLGVDQVRRRVASTRPVRLWSTMPERQASLLEAEQAAMFGADGSAVLEHRTFADEGVYYEALRREAAAGTLPDVFRLQTFELAAAVAAGWLAPLSGWLAQDAAALQVDDFWPDQLAQLEVDGEQWALPTELSTFGVYYNATLFEEVGVQPPADAWTWSDYFEAGRAFVRDGARGRTRWGISHSFTNWLMMGFFRAEGGATFSEDGRACRVDQERNRDLLDVLRTQMDAGVVRHPDLGSRLDAFVEQEVAVYLDGSYATNAVRDRVQGRFRWDTAALPRGSTGERHVSAAGGCWVVAAGAGRSQAAWDLVRWLTRPGDHPVTAQDSGSLPNRRSLLDAWARDAVPPGQPPAHVEVFRRQLERDGAFWRYPKFWSEFDEVWKSAMSDWYASGDARAALSRVQRVSNEAARRYR